MRRWISRLLRDCDGVTSVEYSVMLAMILLATIGAIGLVGQATGGLWGNISTEVSQIMTGN